LDLEGDFEGGFEDVFEGEADWPLPPSVEPPLEAAPLPSFDVLLLASPLAPPELDELPASPVLD
jgi:hypothetical protein